MKRLLAAGYDRIFQICKCWRHGERGTRHMPEFTMLEWYRAKADYSRLMEDCERFLTSLSAGRGSSPSVVIDGHSILLSPPWERITVREAFERFTETTMEDALDSDRFDELLVNDIEPKLGFDTPALLYDYPAERAALARLRSDDPAVAERFELYVGGIELANGFSELTDVTEQRFRFRMEEQFRRSTGRIPYPETTRFFEELPAMPPSAGIALGIDRLIMIMLDAPTIDDVVAFTPEEL
jgi:lysyl-tRNA synthetase class 2